MQESKLKKKSSPPVIKDKIRIKNSKMLFADVNKGAQEAVVAYDNRDKNPNKFKRVFREKIFGKLSDNVILGQKYQNFTKKVTVKKVLKLVVYTLLAVTIIAVANMALLEKFASAINEYIDTTSDIKDRKIVEIIKSITGIFVTKMKELSILQRLLTGTIFINTIVNQIPTLYKDAGNAASLPFFEMLKKLFMNMVSLENKNIISSGS